MLDAQLVGGLIIIGILIYSALMHALVFYRLRNHRVDGVFSLFCLSVAAYAATNIVALYFVTDTNTYITTSKLSSVFVIFAVITMPWFAAEFLHDKSNIPLKPIVIILAPFFLLNLIMENGILWSSIDGIALSPRSWGNSVMRPLNPVISLPMYALWVVIAGIYVCMVRAAYKEMRKNHPKRGLLLLNTLIILMAGLLFDMLIDLGVNKSYFYISEYAVLAFVVLMSLHLSDELRLYSIDLESIVAERTQALELANNELESFSYSVSHDLRAPLRAVGGFVEMLKEDHGQSLNKHAHQLMDKISVSISQMQNMIDGLLHLARVSRGELTRRELNLTEQAEEIIDRLRDKDPGREVNVTIEQEINCFCDPSLVRILLENLFENAWKYTRHVDVPEISLTHYVSSDGKSGFAITDNGAGFDGRFTDKLFMPFQRLHSEEEFPGIGIGLATVARIVKRHGGSIWAKGEKGKGATFYVVLE